MNAVGGHRRRTSHKLRTSRRRMTRRARIGGAPPRKRVTKRRASRRRNAVLGNTDRKRQKVTCIPVGKKARVCLTGGQQGGDTFAFAGNKVRIFDRDGKITKELDIEVSGDGKMKVMTTDKTKAEPRYKKLVELLHKGDLSEFDSYQNKGVNDGAPQAGPTKPDATQPEATHDVDGDNDEIEIDEDELKRKIEEEIKMINNLKNLRVMRGDFDVDGEIKKIKDSTDNDSEKLKKIIEIRRELQVMPEKLIESGKTFSSEELDKLYNLVVNFDEKNQDIDNTKNEIKKILDHNGDFSEIISNENFDKAVQSFDTDKRKKSFIDKFFLL